jgi:septal ring factor EnvC (AmiA/AmiB activator)
MTKKEDTKKYHLSLKLKSVDELVDIILRKDDKEKEKNKQISQLERKIKHYKDYQKDTENEIAQIKQDCKRLEHTIDVLKKDNENMFKLKNKYLLQSKSLMFTAILELIIIFIFVAMFSI